LIRVRIAVYLHDETGVGAIEIDKVTAKPDLLAELGIRNVAVAKRLPQFLLWFGRIVPNLSLKFERLLAGRSLHLPLTLPPPSAAGPSLSPKGRGV
jgi:hypothetical protein